VSSHASGRAIGLLMSGSRFFMGVIDAIDAKLATMF
jgi:hypothetical protein